MIESILSWSHGLYLSLLPFSYCKSPRTNNSWSLPSNPRIYQEWGDSFCIEIIFRFDVLTLKPSIQFDHGKNFLSLSETETRLSGELNSVIFFLFFEDSHRKHPIRRGSILTPQIFFNCINDFVTTRRVWCFFRAPNGVSIIIPMVLKWWFGQLLLSDF